MVDSFEDVADMVVYCIYSVEPFFCGAGGKLVVVVEVYDAWIKSIKTFVRGEFVCSSSYGVIGKFWER